MALRPVFKVGGAVIRPIAGKAASAAGRVGAMPIPIVKLPVRAAVAPISKVTVRPAKKVLSIAAKPAKIVSAQINKNLGVFIGTLPKKQAARVVSSKAPRKISAGKIIQRPKDLAKMKIIEPVKTRIGTFIDVQKAFFGKPKKGFAFKGPSFIQQFQGQLTGVKTVAPKRTSGLTMSEINLLEKQFTASVTGKGLGRKGGVMWRSDVGGGFGGGGQVFESVTKTADTPIMKASGQETVQKTGEATTKASDDKIAEAYARESTEEVVQESAEDVIMTIDGKWIKRKDLKKFGYNEKGEKSYKPADAPDPAPRRGGITSDDPLRVTKPISSDERWAAALSEDVKTKLKVKTKAKIKVKEVKKLFEDPIVKGKKVDTKSGQLLILQKKKLKIKDSIVSTKEGYPSFRQRLKTDKELSKFYFDKKQKSRQRFLYQQQQEAKYRRQQQNLFEREELLKEKQRVKLKQKQEAALKKKQKKRVKQETEQIAEPATFVPEKNQFAVQRQAQMTEEIFDQGYAVKVGQLPREAFQQGILERQAFAQAMKQDMLHSSLFKEMLGTRQITPQIIDQLSKQDQLMSLKQAAKQRQKAMQEARLAEQQRLREQQRLKIFERLDEQSRIDQQSKLKQEPIVRQKLRLDTTPRLGLKMRPGLDLIPRLDLATRLDVGLKTDVSLRTDLTARQDQVPRLDTAYIPKMDIPTPTKLDIPTYLLPSLTMRAIPEARPRGRPRPRKGFGGPPFLPFGWPGSGTEVPKKTLASRSIFAKEIKRDIGVLKIFGGKKK